MSLLSATSKICDRCGKTCTSEEVVQIPLGPVCLNHPTRMLNGGLHSHWLARGGDLTPHLTSA
jgi:hypothetical protein